MDDGAMSETVTVKVTRRIEAPSARVFDAWIEPKSIETWMLAPAPGEMVRIELDPREGGEFCFTARRGGEEIEHLGVYLAFRRPHTLAFTWMVPRYSKDMTRIAVEMTPLGKTTQLTLTHDGVLPEYDGPTRAGWTAILDAIAATARA